MLRIATSALLGATLLTGIAGCGDAADADDEKMTQRRAEPAEKRRAPGSGLGMSTEGGEEGAEEPPTDDGTGG